MSNQIFEATVYLSPADIKLMEFSNARNVYTIAEYNHTNTIREMPSENFYEPLNIEYKDLYLYKIILNDVIYRLYCEPQKLDEVLMYIDFMNFLPKLTTI